MDLKDMEYFCTIVEEGQISKAAKKLNISQPPLSLRLKEMESEIGRTLIQRNCGQWKVTAEGQVLYQKSQQILSHARGLAETVRNAVSEPSGIITIGIGAHCMSYFRKIVPELCIRYPRISCRTIVTDSPTVEAHLQDRTVEVAILRLNLSRDNCTTWNLPEQRLVAVYSNLFEPPDHPGTVTFKELVRHPLLFSRRWADSEGFRPIMAAFQKNDLHPNIVVDTQYPQLLFQLLHTTPAVAIMPDTEIPEAREGYFQVRPIDHYVVFQPVLAWLRESYLTPQACALVELVKEFFPHKDA